MRRFWTQLIATLCTLLAVAGHARAQGPGDFLLIGWLDNAIPDDFAFVTLAPIATGTEIYFTDNGWTGAQFRGASAFDGNGNEDLCRWTALAPVDAGTVVRSSDTGASFAWTFTGSIGTTTQLYGHPALSQAGDQLYAFTTSSASNPLLSPLTHLAVLDDTGAFEAATSAATGDIPPGLSSGSGATTFAQNAAGQHFMGFQTSVLPCATQAGWTSAMASASNWSFGASGTLPAGAIVLDDGVDSDGDGTNDCADGCPADSAKLAPGVCGCGVPDTDSDGDGSADCIDGCPSDPNKTASGICGCGVSDVDTDGDGAADCVDGCPNDSGKIAPGQCGCGTPDTDTDGDGVADCNDLCPDDPAKTVPGICGCGVSDVDTDFDGAPDCVDGCPLDSNKTSAGICGCGVSDADTDGDGTADCNDGCPNDPDKTLPGTCGCGVADTDTDGDGTADCNDGCPNDPNKTTAGICGCGVSDADTDGDGTADCSDGCPNDPNKTSAGVCGCGVSDVDTDGDGTADCNDGCPNDSGKIAPGQCGCGTPDTDTDGDSVADCNDNCDAISNPGQADCDGDGVGDACEIGAGSFDANGNQIPDECESTSTMYCFADTQSFLCPCGNDATAGNEGCKNSTNRGATLYNSGGNSVGADDSVLTVIHLPLNKSGLVFMGNNQVSLPFGDGVLCASGQTKRFPATNSGASGSFTQTGLIALSGGAIGAGAIKNFQGWYRDPLGPCAGASNLSSAVQITFVP